MNINPIMTEFSAMGRISRQFYKRSYWTARSWTMFRLYFGSWSASEKTVKESPVDKTPPTFFCSYIHCSPFSSGKLADQTVTSSSHCQQRHIVPLGAGLQQCKGSHHSPEEFIYISIKRWEREGGQEMRKTGVTIVEWLLHGKMADIRGSPLHQNVALKSKCKAFCGIG